MPTPKENARRRDFHALYGATGGTLESRACCTIGTNVYPNGTEATGITFCPLHSAAGIMQNMLNDLRDDLDAIVNLPLGQVLLQVNFSRERIISLLENIVQDEAHAKKGTP